MPNFVTMEASQSNFHDQRWIPPMDKDGKFFFQHSPPTEFSLVYEN